MEPSCTKKRGGINIVKACIDALRHRQPPGKKTETRKNEANPRTMLNRVVGSIRPLHLQDVGSPIHPSAVPASDHFEDTVLPSPLACPWGKARRSLSSRSSVSDEGGTSRYASAVNLQELDRAEDGNGEESEGGDEMIDVKAEQFIARFYQEMRMNTQN